MVERKPSKLDVAGSSPVSRSPANRVAVSSRSMYVDRAGKRCWNGSLLAAANRAAAFAVGRA